MNVVEFNVNNQILSRKTKTKIVNKSHNYLKFCFDFSSEWDTTIKEYLICKDSKGAYQFDVNDGVVIIPFPLIAEKQLFITLYGVYPDRSRITTNEVPLKLVHSGYTREISSIDGESAEDVISRFDFELEHIQEVMSHMVDNIVLEDGVLKGYCDGEVVFSYTLDDSHTHTVSTIPDFGENTAVEIRSAFRYLKNAIRSSSNGG